MKKHPHNPKKETSKILDKHQSAKHEAAEGEPPMSMKGGASHPRTGSHAPHHPISTPQQAPMPMPMPASGGMPPPLPSQPSPPMPNAPLPPRV